MTQLTYCARFVNGVLLLFLITIMHSDLIQLIHCCRHVRSDLWMGWVLGGLQQFC